MQRELASADEEERRDRWRRRRATGIAPVAFRCPSPSLSSRPLVHVCDDEEDTADCCCCCFEELFERFCDWCSDSRARSKRRQQEEARTNAQRPQQ